MELNDRELTNSIEMNKMNKLCILMFCTFFPLMVMMLMISMLMLMLLESGCGCGSLIGEVR